MDNVGKKKRVFAITLGCKLNYAETSSILDRFVKNGWEIAEGDDMPDLVIIHTCAVTSQAGQKSRQQIRKMIKRYPRSRIAVTGCYAQLHPDRLETIDGVHVILGVREKYIPEKYMTEVREAVYRELSSPESIQDAEPAHSLVEKREKGRTRAFLKIQDGCDYACAYCTIPLARGKSRSVPLETVLAGAGRLAEAGYHEIVLTGVNIADYRSGRNTFVDLLLELESVDVSRIRISSIEPDILSDRLIETVASSSKIMPHFHLPLQSGSDAILAAMGRRYSATGYRERLMKAVSAIPHCAVGADVIIGYPGETDADFMATFGLLESIPAAYLHVFTCSLRPGTQLSRQVSSGIRQNVSSAVSRERSRLLHELAEKKQREYASCYLGKTLAVLFEEHRGMKGEKGMVSGYSPNYLRVQCRIGSSAQATDIVGRERSVMIENLNEDLILEGRIVT